MPLDPSIYGLQKQPENPLDQYGKALNLRALMDQSRLQQLQTGQLEKNISREDATDAVFANAPSGATLESLLPEVYRAGGAAKGVEFQGKLLTQQKTRADLEKTQMELTSKAAELHRESLSGVDSPQAAAQWVQSGYADPRLNPVLSRGGTVEQAIARIPTDPAQFQQWKAQNGMGIQKFLEMQNTNAQHSLNRDVTTRGQDLSATTAREGHALTERGQNMTDQRQRELNGILDGQTNTPSPALIDSIGKHEIELKPPPTNARNPVMLQRYGQMLEAVKSKYPNWGADQFPAVKKVEASFAAGPDAKTIQALSNATGHLDTYERLALAMKNGDSQAINAITNKIREQFGSDAPTNPQAVAQFLSAEIVKAASGAAGGVADREHMASVFANKSSPTQMVGAANTVREIMGQQFRTLDQKYKSGTYGRTDFADKYLTLPEVRDAYDKAIKAHGAKPSADAPAGALIATVKSDEDFDKLKPGTEFVGPDGKRRRKP